MKKALIGIFCAFLSLALSNFAFAASNPSGTGQPNQDCEAIGTMPNGFTTDGFAHAKTVYAGSGASAIHANSIHAVSQYDIACYQVSQH